MTAAPSNLCDSLEMTEMENIMVNVVITQTYVIKCVRLPPPHLQIMIWNLDCPEQLIKNPVKTISHHTDVVLSMSFNTDCSLLATTCKDRKIRLMEPRSGNLLRVTLTVFASLRKKPSCIMYSSTWYGAGFICTLQFFVLYVDFSFFTCLRLLQFGVSGGL